MAIRVAAPFVFLSLLLLALGVSAAWYVHMRDREMARHLQHDSKEGIAAEELVITAGRVETHLDQYMLTSEARHLAAIPRLLDVIRLRLHELESLAGSPRETVWIKSMAAAADRLRDEFTSLRARSASEFIAPEIRELSSLVLTREIRIPAQAYLDEQETQIAESISENHAMRDWIAGSLLALGSCGALAGLLGGYVIARGVRRSFAQLSVPVHDAAGRLSAVVGPITVTPARDAAGLENMLVSLARDVGTVVDRLDESRRAALRSEQLAALGQWAAGLAHELRNPLTSMKILVQTAIERSERGEVGLQGRSLAVLDQEIGRLDHLLQSFLQFARPAEVERRRVDFASILRQKVALCEPQARARRVAIVLDLPSNPPSLEADAAHLRQLLLNLILNAIDASPAGGTITIRAVVDRQHQDSPDQARVVIQVIDEGPGLPPGLGDRMFEPFVSTKGSGLGLGLSISKRIVEAHGGSLTADDRPGGGAVFTVGLPLPDPGREPHIPTEFAAPPSEANS